MGNGVTQRITALETESGGGQVAKEKQRPGREEDLLGGLISSSLSFLLQWTVTEPLG